MPGRVLAPGPLVALVALTARAAAESAPEAAAESNDEAVVETSDAAVEADREPVSSVSCGWPNHGALAGGVELPPRGEGYVVPEPWRERGSQHGTRELVGLIERAAARVAREHPGAVLGVADLSAPGGGSIRLHRSHQSGRDADLLYYAVDSDGEPMDPDGHMPQFRADGIATWARAPASGEIEERSFDGARNWSLVAAMLTDPEVRVHRIFVSYRVRRWLLEHARDAAANEELVQQAESILVRPSNVGGHNDHMHVRIACSERDRDLGDCHDDSRPRRRRGGMTCPANPPQDDSHRPSDTASP